MIAANTLVSLYICTGMHEPWLLNNAFINFGTCGLVYYGMLTRIALLFYQAVAMDVSVTSVSSPTRRRRKNRMRNHRVTRPTVNSVVSVTALTLKQSSSHTAGNQPVCSSVLVGRPSRRLGRSLRGEGRNSRRRKRGPVLEKLVKHFVY